MGFFVDWVGLVGGSISTIFAWNAFNRDSFADNVVMRQNQKYQEKNYRMSWVAIARDDIRDMMGISVNRINNYMLVATLILGMAGGALTSLSFTEATPGFLLYASYLSVGISIVFLVLSIVFGVAGQNTAFGETMDLLIDTREVQPQAPTRMAHDYMSQAQWIEKQGGLRELFRIPGVRPETYENENGKDPAPKRAFSRWRRSRPSTDQLEPGIPSGTSCHATGAGEAIEQEPGIPSGTWSHATSHVEESGIPSGIRSHATSHVEDSHAPSERSNGVAAKSPEEEPLECLNHARDAGYLTKFRRFMELWQPYEIWSKYTMSLGILSFGHGLAYWSLGKLMSEKRPLGHWAGLAMFLPYIYVVSLIAYMNLGVDLGEKTPTTKRGNALLMTLVVMILVGGPVVNGLSTLKPIMAHPRVHQGFVLIGYLLHFVFWLMCFFITLRQEEERLSDKRGTNGMFHLGQPLLRPGVTREPTGSEDSCSEDSRSVVSGGEVDELMGSSVRQRRRTEVIVESANTAAGISSRATAATTWTAQMDSKGMTEEEGDVEDRWCTDEKDFGERTAAKTRSVRIVVMLAIGATAFIWAAMCIWVMGNILVESNTSFDAEAGVRATWFTVDWPDPLFKPGQMACTAEDKTQMKHIFVANKFSIYSLKFEQGEEHLMPELKIKCGKLEGEIVDVSALCDDHGGCRPFVLIKNNEFTKVVDCARPEEDSHMKWTGLPAPKFISVQPHGLSMVVELDNSLVIWKRTNSTSEWRAHYDIGVANEDLSDIDYGFGENVFFRNVRPGWFTAAIEQYNSTTMHKMKAWRIPYEIMPLAAGCMLKEGVQALVLPSRDRKVGSKHNVVRLDLNR